MDTAVTTGGLGFVIWVWLSVWFISSFKTCNEFVQRCGDAGSLQRLLMYTKHYQPDRGDFNAHHWLSQSRRHNKVPEHVSKYRDLWKRTRKTTPQAVC